MRILLIVFLLSLVPFVCNAEVVLHRYYEGAEERGISYSDKDGNMAANNPAWSCEIIPEKDKEMYIALQKQQYRAKLDADKALINKEKGTARTKLKASGLSDKEISVLLGDYKDVHNAEIIE